MSKDVHALVLSSTVMSIVLSIYLFATGKRETGIFIGLWAPTITALGIYAKLDEHMKQQKHDEAA